MNEFFASSVYAGIFLTLAAYGIGQLVRKKWNHVLLNPFLIAAAVILAVLTLGDIDYASYYNGGKYIGMLLTPATVCLGIPLYRQFETLKKNWKALLAGITAGALASLISVLLLSRLFDFTHAEYVTFLPKSVTSAIGMGISEELGGYPPVTVAVIIITGMFGSMIAEPLYRLLHVTDRMAKGVGLGTASHGLGAAKAVELGDIEGAMSSLSVVVSGLLTVVGASVFAGFM